MIFSPVVVGKTIFGLYFLYNGINHFAHLQAMSGYARSKGVPAAKLAVTITGLLLILGGVAAVLGSAQVATFILLVFLIPTTIIMHNFWTVHDPQQKMMETVQFMKNIALIGATLMLMGM